MLKTMSKKQHMCLVKMYKYTYRFRAYYAVSKHNIMLKGK